jgi:hypothetical protein
MGSLVEILAAELTEWPVGQTAFWCDPDNEIRGVTGYGYDFRPKGRVDEQDRGKFFGDESVCTVTKQEWEAARIISQPQAEEVEVHIPNAKTVEAMDATDRGEGRTFNSAQDLYAALDITSKAKTDQIDGPIKWRDEVTELNAYIDKFTRERDALIELLASEGFALIPPVASVMSEFDVADMSDWLNWKVGDIVEVIANMGGHEFNIGDRVHVVRIDLKDSKYRIEAQLGDGDDWWLLESDAKWISRP